MTNEQNLKKDILKLLWKNHGVSSFIEVTDLQWEYVFSSLKEHYFAAYVQAYPPEAIALAAKLLSESLSYHTYLSKRQVFGECYNENNRDAYGHIPKAGHFSKLGCMFR